jgi:long-chain acyl-CoA synthetase
MSITRVFDVLDHLQKNFQKDDLICAKERTPEKAWWKKYSTTDFIHHSYWVAYGLRKLGIQPGDKVAIISNNRPEWNFTDYGCQLAGAVSVPIFPTVSNNDLKFIINDAEVKAVFVSSKEIYKKLAAIETEIPRVKFVYSYEPIEGLLHFDSLLELGKKNESKEEINKITASIKPDDLFTILYTSGTTGLPKGVMLSHNNLVSNVMFALKLAPFEKSWRALSFLPLNHVLERMVTTVYFYCGISVYYAEGYETIGDNLKEIQPQIFVSVPRLIERVYERMLSAGDKLKGWKKKLFYNAVEHSLKYDVHGMSATYQLKRKFYDLLVYSKWRAALGGKLVCMVSGGAALQPRLARVFMCANVKILEGYGLTETSPAIAVNTFEGDGIRIGTVGPVFKNTQVKIAEDGEILVKGPGVMLGYYKNEEATKEVIDEQGWFHTGDIGTFVEDKFLKITDRKKEIFKTSAGKYIAPLMIENKLKECRFVEQCMVVGAGEKFASALIVPSFDYIKDWCKKSNIEFTTNEEMAGHPELKKEISMFIREMNKSLAPYEQIKKPELVTTPWTIDGGEMTPKLSMKRKVIEKKHEQMIRKIFSQGEE